MYGLRVTGDAGQIQVYSSIPNYVLKSKGVAYVPYSPGASYTTVNVPMSLTPTSLLFIKPRIVGAPVAYWYGYRGDLTKAVMVSQQSVYVDWYVFDLSETVTDFRGEYGLRVYDGSHKLTYSSASNALKLLGMLKVPDAPSSITYSDLSTHILTVPTGRALAGYLSNAREYLGQEDPFPEYHYDGVAVGNGYVRCQQVVSGFIADTAPKGTIASLVGGLLIAADVTGL